MRKLVADEIAATLKEGVASGDGGTLFACPPSGILPRNLEFTKYDSTGTSEA